MRPLLGNVIAALGLASALGACGNSTGLSVRLLNADRLGADLVKLLIAGGGTAKAMVQMCKRYDRVAVLPGKFLKKQGQSD